MHNPPVNLVGNVQLDSVLFTSHVFQLPFRNQGAEAQWAKVRALPWKPKQQHK